MMRIGHKIRISAPSNEIFSFLMDIDNRSSYIPALDDVILLDKPPLREGSRYVEVSRIAGRSFKTTYQLTELIPGKRIGAKTLESVFPIEVRMEIQEDESGSILILFLQFELSGIYRFGKNIIRNIVDRQAREILRKIKRSIESSAIR